MLEADKIEAIKRVKARYFRAIDTKDAALLQSTFCSDVVCDFRGSMADPHRAENHALLSEEEPLRGAQNAGQAIIEAVKGLVTIHHGHMPDIVFTSADTAHGIWAMMDILDFPAGSPRERITGYGFYYDNYRIEDGIWKIASLRLERLRVDIQAAKIAAEGNSL